jgi:predicted porin
MQKKLLAVAVAGALAAPGLAMAQATATGVTLYGTISASFESAQATGADTATSGTSSLRGGNTGASAYAATPGNQESRYRTQASGSNFGVRVREDLGGGMYAWVQLELSMNVGGIGNQSASSGSTFVSNRNSAIALGGSSWGDIVLGIWDSPFNVNMNPAPQHAPYANPSTSFSAQLFGGNPLASGTHSAQPLGMHCNTSFGLSPAGTTADCFVASMTFHRRVADSIQYWSPSWSGFQVKAQYGTESGNKQAVAAGTPNPPNGSLKPSLWAGSVTYSAGPLYVGVGYERHKDLSALGAQLVGGTGFTLNSVAGGSTAPVITIRSGATGVSGSTDTAWNLNARYTFGAFTVGGYYESLKWSWNYGTDTAGDLKEMKKKAWGLEGAWVGGPHTVGIRYARAKKLELGVSSLTAAGTNADDSGATGWIFGYAYSLSKRSSAYVYHTRITNDANARYTGIVFSGISGGPGSDPRYTGVGLRHTF